MPRSATSLLLTSGLAIIALLLVSAPSVSSARGARNCTSAGAWVVPPVAADAAAPAQPHHLCLELKNSPMSD